MTITEVILALLEENKICESHLETLELTKEEKNTFKTVILKNKNFIGILEKIKNKEVTND